jgi:hypothetical protein
LEMSEPLNEPVDWVNKCTNFYFSGA